MASTFRNTHASGPWLQLLAAIGWADTWKRPTSGARLTIARGDEAARDRPLSALPEPGALRLIALSNEGRTHGLALPSRMSRNRTSRARTW